MTRQQFARRLQRRLRVVSAVFLPIALSACRSDEQDSLPADARVILEAHISHGLGNSPFDSPLVGDSIAALLIVRARECASMDALRDVYSDTAQVNVLLDRLRSSRILENRGALTCTTFPVLVGRTRDQYGALADSVAQQAYLEFAEDWAALLQMIRDRGWQDWQYHFVWSQMFDSQFAWATMMTRGLVPPLNQLVAWVVFPEHTFRSGTNYYPDDELRDYWLMVTWRAGGSNTTVPVAALWDVLYRAGATNSPLTAEERNQLSSLGVVDGTGALDIPVLRPHDALYEVLQSISERYVAYIEQRMPLGALATLSGVDNRHAFAMAYHDVSWGIVERLVSSGAMEVPPALQRNRSTTPLRLRGAFALTPAYTPFVDLIRSAIGAQ